MLHPSKKSVAELSARVAEKLHADKRVEGAQLAADWLAQQTGRPIVIANEVQAVEVLTLLLHWLLDNEGYEEAANLLWGKTLFNAEPESAQRVWRAFEDSNFILLMGAASMSKSYSIGVRLLLEYVRDPDYTDIQVVGPTEQHLEDNLFSHLVSLHKQSTIPLPGEIGKLFIGGDARSRKGSIRGIIIPIGKKSGRLQGSKRVPRKVPHPIFGPLSRKFVFLDEISNIPVGIWKDIDNLMGAYQGDGEKIIGAFNPANMHDETGKRVEPKNGWQEFDIEKDVDWVSTRDWRVVRLDAARSENVVQRKVIYPGLQTYEGLQKLIKNAGGTDSPGYYSMGRGCFPPAGVSMSIFPAGMLARIKAEPIWYDTPTPIAAVDVALMGGDVAMFCKGSFGTVTGVNYPSSLEHPKGRCVMFKDSKGRSLPRSFLFVEALLPIPQSDTVKLKDEIVRLCRTYSIRPEYFCIDRTGNGQGVYDLLRFDFGEIIGVNYTESASPTKVLAEDHATGHDLYDRMQSELWFAARKFTEFDYCKIAADVPNDELFPQLTTRRYKVGKRAKVESKDEYQSRCSGKSPDAADAFTLLVHCARRAFSFIPGMVAENSSDSHASEFREPESEQRIDPTNRFEDI